MYDFIKVSIKENCIAEILDNERLNFASKLNFTTGEISPTRIANYQGLQLRANPNGMIQLLGSVHKYHNNGHHNHNDYGFKEYSDTLDRLSFEIGFNPSNTIVHCLEVGVNIKLPVSTSTILDSIIMHKTKRFTGVNIKGGNYKLAQQSQYCIKAYDKGLQYHLPDGVFRFELKIVKAQRINKDGYYSMTDLLSSSVRTDLSTQLLRCWDDVLFIDHRLTHSSTLEDRYKAFRWSDPAHWERVQQTSKGTLKNRYYRERRQCQEWANDRSDLKNTIRDAISDKLGTFYTSYIR